METSLSQRKELGGGSCYWWEVAVQTVVEVVEVVVFVASVGSVEDIGSVVDDHFLEMIVVVVEYLPHHC